MNTTKKIKVLIVDDSALMRQLLTAVLHEDPIFHVVGTAANPLIAREKIKTLNPDVLTLDVEMPGMDGITFLEKLMRLRPMPVVMVSSLTKQGATATLRALDLGAIDFVTKPQANGLDGMSEEVMEEIRAKVRTAAMAHVRALPALSAAPERAQLLTLAASPGNNRFVAIGASAGGTQAIAEILPKLPLQTPGIAIVQHMPPKFTAMLAERLNEQCQIEVREAKDGDWKPSAPDAR